MKKLLTIAAIPVTVSLATLYLWAKIMEAFDDMLVDFSTEPVIPDWLEHEEDVNVWPIIEGTDEQQRRFKDAVDRLFADLDQYDEP